MSTLTGHLSLYATQSLKAIDNWMNVAQGNIGNSLRTASKEVELMYGGGLTHELRPTSSTKNGVQIGEQVLTTGNTRTDWSQGEIISSPLSSHMAIVGEGFFMVYDPDDKKVFLTRDGEFRDNGTGQCINALGQVLVDAAMAINLGLNGGAFPYTAPTSVAAGDLDTEWSPLVIAPGANGATPYGIPGAGAGSLSVQAKYSFFVNESAITGPINVNFRNDNEGFLFVNGALVASHAWPALDVTVDIAPYLRDGANIITVQNSNSGGPGGFILTGTIPGAAAYDGSGTPIVLDTGTAPWAAKVYGPYYPSPLNNQFEVQPQDVLLVNTSRKDELKYSKFGSTIWDSPFPIDSNNYIAALPETNGVGRVLNKSLEASNIRVERNITELAAMGKIYNGFVQLIKVYNSNLDEVLGFIR